MKFWNKKPWRDERSRKKKPYIPKGCNQQGRHPAAAEAATDLGADDTPPPDMLKVVLGDLAIAAALLAVVAVVVLVAWAAVTENGKLYKAASTRESAERKAEQQEAKFGDTWRPLHVVPLYTAPPQRKPLPKHDQHCVDVPGYGLMAVRLVRAVERAHGIGGQNDNANS